MFALDHEYHNKYTCYAACKKGIVNGIIITHITILCDNSSCYCENILFLSSVPES